MIEFLGLPASGKTSVSLSFDESSFEVILSEKISSMCKLLGFLKYFHYTFNVDLFFFVIKHLRLSLYFFGLVYVCKNRGGNLVLDQGIVQFGASLIYRGYTIHVSKFFEIWIVFFGIRCLDISFIDISPELSFKRNTVRNSYTSFKSSCITDFYVFHQALFESLSIADTMSLVNDFRVIYVK